MELTGHCKDHETNMARGIGNESCIASMMRQREKEFDRMTDIHEDIYGKLGNLEKGKIDMATFRWFMSGLGVIAVLIFVTLMGLSSSMSTVKADMRVLLAEVKAEAKSEMQPGRTK
jgi:hypothetical protein